MKIKIHIYFCVCTWECLSGFLELKHVWNTYFNWMNCTFFYQGIARKLRGMSAWKSGDTECLFPPSRKFQRVNIFHIYNIILNCHLEVSLVSQVKIMQQCNTRKAHFPLKDNSYSPASYIHLQGVPQHCLMFIDFSFNATSGRNYICSAQRCPFLRENVLVLRRD